MKPGAKRVVRDLSFKDWMARPDNFATREQVVAFWNLALREQVVPLLREIILSYEADVRERRWYRRLWRWIRGLGRPLQMNREQALAVLEREGVDLAEVARRHGPEAVGGAAEPAGNGEAQRTCVTCGSAQLGPVNERGGLKCDRGHIIEDPPAEDVDRAPASPSTA